jgi:hypothetical protein
MIFKATLPQLTFIADIGVTVPAAASVRRDEYLWKLMPAATSLGSLETVRSSKKRDTGCVLTFYSCPMQCNSSPRSV